MEINPKTAPFPKLISEKFEISFIAIIFCLLFFGKVFYKSHSFANYNVCTEQKGFRLDLEKD